MKLNYNRFFFHFTEMRILTHINFFYFLNLSWLRWLLVDQLNFFLPNFEIFVTFFCYSTLPPLAFGFKCGGGMSRWWWESLGVVRWGGCSGSGGGGFSGGGVQVGGFSGEGSKGTNVRGIEGSKWGKLGRGEVELNGIFLQFEFRFWHGLGRTLALQSFRITHLINAEFLAKFCTAGETKKMEKNPFQCDFLLIIKSIILDSKWFIMHFVLARKNGLKSIFSPILLSERNMGIDYIYNIFGHNNLL